VLDSFIIYIFNEGKFDIKSSEGNTTVLKGETVLIPAEMNIFDLIPAENSEVLEVYIS
jgi:mannose-6-phosphate isomerase